MAGIVTLTFQGADFTEDTTLIMVDGGTIVLEATASLSLNGTIPFTSLSITSGAININGQAGVAVDGNISFPVNATNSAPTITVDNFSGTANISWPSNTGPQLAQLSPGEVITLDGFQN